MVAIPPLLEEPLDRVSSGSANRVLVVHGDAVVSLIRHRHPRNAQEQHGVPPGDGPPPMRLRSWLPGTDGTIAHAVVVEKVQLDHSRGTPGIPLYIRWDIAYASTCLTHSSQSGEGKPMDKQLWHRISVEPKVMVGKPVIRGTRIPVETIVRMLAQGISEDDILREYPRLQPEDIRAALAYAARVLAHEDVFPLAISA
jgi:uncharacterized protein (DUF433 family)